MHISVWLSPYMRRLSLAEGYLTPTAVWMLSETHHSQLTESPIVILSGGSRTGECTALATVHFEGRRRTFSKETPQLWCVCTLGCIQRNHHPEFTAFLSSLNVLSCYWDWKRPHVSKWRPNRTFLKSLKHEPVRPVTVFWFGVGVLCSLGGYSSCLSWLSTCQRFSWWRHLQLFLYFKSSYCLYKV